MKIVVIVPLHNEENHIAKVLKDVSKYKLPIIVVDDGSTDASKEKVLSTKLKNITLLEHTINLGKGAAMKTGAEYAFKDGVDAIIFMDSDGQHSAADLPSFIKKLKEGKWNIIFGSRNFNMGVPVVRYMGNKIASIVLRVLFGLYVSDSICGFRALTKTGYNKIKWESKGYGVETEMIARVGKNKVSYTEVPVETIYHSSVKGVTILDAVAILGEVVKWRLTI